MKRTSLGLVGPLCLLALASCVADAPTSVGTGEFTSGLTPTLGLVDGDNGQGGNPKFFFLKPLTDAKRSEGPADRSLFPTVEICPRSPAGDACDPNRPLLASFSRTTGADKHRIEVKEKGDYSVHWHMKDFPPEEAGVYRIRVVLQGSELGHADVVTLSKKEIKAFNELGEDVIAISDKGTLKITFRIEEGALEAQFCDFDQDGDVRDCDAGVEVPGDGLPTVLTVVEGNKVAAVVTVPDGVFIDAQGAVIPDVVITAEVEVLPPSKDLILDDLRELPYFVEINTFPDGVFIDPSGPGVSVVLCQDESILSGRGIPDPLHPQLILYKVTDPKPGFPQGQTKRLLSTQGSSVCDGPIPTAFRSTGIVGVLRTAAAGVANLLRPEPLLARRLHGGLNTVVIRDISSSDAAFSTFGATLGPNAMQSTAIVPDGFIHLPTQMLIEVRTALGDVLQFGGDEVDATIVGGPNAGAPVTVVDNGNGTYSAIYTPVLAGVDTVSFLLTTADGWAQGPIGTSPYLSIVGGDTSLGTMSGFPAIVAIWAPTGGPLTITGPNGTRSCSGRQPAGIAPFRALCVMVGAPVSGTYSLSAGSGSTTLVLDASGSLPAPVIDAVTVNGSDVTVDWTGDPQSQLSYWVQVWGGGSLLATRMVSFTSLSGGSGSLTFTGVPLVPGLRHVVDVLAFSADLTTSQPLLTQTNASSAPERFFFPGAAPSPRD